MTVFTPLQSRLKNLLKVNLFDVYEGSNLPDGKIICIKFYHTGPF
jgi:phenylalanyl-tRNA synthetase beta subunit